jgi:hypothetical protein
MFLTILPKLSKFYTSISDSLIQFWWNSTSIVKHNIIQKCPIIYTIVEKTIPEFEVNTYEMFWTILQNSNSIINYPSYPISYSITYPIICLIIIICSGTILLALLRIANIIIRTSIIITGFGIIGWYLNE